MGLKNGAGNGSKGKGKRERSISADSFEQRDAGTPSDESEIKGMLIFKSAEIWITILIESFYY